MRSGVDQPRRLPAGGAVLLAALAFSFGSSPAADAAGPPVIVEAWASQVFSSSARIQAKINPNGASTSYHVDYITRAAYEANLAASKPGFTGTLRTPTTTDFNLGGGSVAVLTGQIAFALNPDTAYLYRLVVKNSQGTVETAPPLSFTTQSNGNNVLLPDSRGWEQVSPIEKNGGGIASPGSLAAGGVFQAAADGQSVAYSSSAAFGAGAQGAPPVSQYLASRGAGAWATSNLSAPLFSGSFDFTNAGDPYQVFSADLARALVLNGDHCRGEGNECGVANPLLAGTSAPEGFENYYLRTLSSGYEALLGNADIAFSSVRPSQFDLSLAGASPNLEHVVLSTCAALTGNAIQEPLGDCEPAKTNLYEFSPGAGLQLVNLKPAQSSGALGASLAAQSGAVSADGSRVYWSQGGDLYLRKNGTTTAVVETGAQFQTASLDGSLAFFTKGAHLFRYEAAGAGTTVDLTPPGGVVGVLGASDDGAYVYFQTAAGIFLAHGGTSIAVTGPTGAGNYPPATGAARVSADGTHLLFLSTARLTGYDNTDQLTGDPDQETFLYSAAGAGSLTCVSCNPTNERPIGPSAVPGAVPNGTAPDAVQSYKPRVLSSNGLRVVFESDDAIALTDTNNNADVYQWEAQGEGSCNRGGGCVALLSSGRSPGGARLVDASSDGSDVFFVTDDSLVASDPGAVDLYDARVGGGFPIPQEPTPCEGDACQPLPPVPVDPTLTTLLSGPGNSAVRYPTAHKCKVGFHKHRGKCVKNAGKKSKRAKGSSRRAGGR
ncbi:MAG: hypothetical protein H0X42_05655 [Solirubrobacterales bacterium]|nr:hypothetical protein [Solirubrobacterales bacterium]